MVKARKTDEAKMGTRLVELRRSNAAGRHDTRPRALRNRGIAQRAAINRSEEGR